MVKNYLNRDLPIEERVEDLLNKMNLEEKLIQLEVRTFPLCKIFSELSEALSLDNREKIRNLSIEMHFKERDMMAEITSFYFRKQWKETIENNGKCSVGLLSCVLSPFSPKESAELANKIQKFAFQETQLKIPIIIQDIGCSHGSVSKGCTVFPQSIALASSWNPVLIKKVATAIGKEMRARGIYQCLSPTINIARDPRCGRTEETYGEDPYLASVIASSFVEGVQSQKVVTTLRHFAANFVGDGGRDSNAIHLSERILREIYFPPFRDCVQKANALSIMSAYNSIDGVPCSCNKRLLTDLLRNEWKFKGFVVSDYSSVAGLYNKHKVAKTKAEAAKKAIEAGLDVELPETDCYRELLSLVKKEKLSEEVIDESVRRVLSVKFWLGLFDNPYVKPEDAEKICNCDEHRKMALEAAREGIILLKNNGILPLHKDLKSIAVIGPNANEIRLGGYSGYRVKVVTPLKGIENKVSKNTVVYFAKGCKSTGNSKEGFEKAIRIAERSEVVVLVVGNSSQTESEAKDRCNLDLPGVQEDLVKEICNTGTPVAVVLINGSAITITNWLNEVEAVVEAWYLGEEGGNAIADVLFGNYNPGGKLPITFPQKVGQLPLNYNYKPSGRIYDYVDLRGKQTMFSFGHGLSYTKFEYSNLKISPRKISSRENINISVDVENVGEYKGDEVIQLYVHDPVATIARPIKELKGFKRVNIKPGESKTVDFTLTPEDLTFYDIDMNLVLEPGIIEVMIGSSSEDIRLKGSFEVK